MVQARQTRKWHQDANYALAIFQYLKEMAIRYQDLYDFVFMDDKHKCKVGKPHAPVAAVERGKAVVVSVDGKKFSALDHDFTRCSITPSVTLFCHIPKDIEDSFQAIVVKCMLDRKILNFNPPRLTDMQLRFPNY